MKNNYKKIFAYTVSSLFLFVPFLIFADYPDTSITTIKNPLRSDDIQGILLNIMDLVSVVGGIIVVLFIIYSGFKFVAARGNPEELKTAKNIFYATIIGGAILLGARIIADVVVNTVETTLK